MQACRGRVPARTPVWLMRQAGRYMACYRALREKYSLLQLVHTPELACRVTLQPVDAFGVDAAIVFSDILPLLCSLGLRLEFVTGEGPRVTPPLRHESDIAALSARPIEESVEGTLRAIRLLAPELEQRGIPLIGFSGAPFTLASYAIEGGSSRQHLLAKELMLRRPDLWDHLMRLLARQVTDYLLAQARAGAHALQLFDSWSGWLSPAHTQHYVLPHVQAICMAVKRAAPGVPLIYFSTGNGGWLHLIKQVPCDVIGLDWRVDLSTARRQLGLDRAVQGNLDPAVLLAPWRRVEQETLAAVHAATAATRAGYIFNLGHGVLPRTDEDTVRRLVHTVRHAELRLHKPPGTDRAC
ncbi:MAG: uroporphyrinogen decarboxylase [Myxococcota bacterium]